MPIHFFRGALGAAALLAISVAASAQQPPHRAQPERVYRAGALVVESPWSRETPGGAKVGGGYMRIINGGTEPDRLVGGTMPLAARFELHEVSMHGDTARMRLLERGLEIPPGKTVELKPGGSHAMFVGLKQPLKAGDTLKGTLVFEKAGTVAVEYTVRPLGSTGAAAGHHH